MADRKLASDARRVVNGGDSRKESAAVRKILSQQYERGKRDGRLEHAAEVDAVDPRTLLLNTAADGLDHHGARLSGIPNSDRASTAFKEASAILRDAAALGTESVAVADSKAA